jgi:hypothetical protein
VFGLSYYKTKAKYTFHKSQGEEKEKEKGKKEQWKKGIMEKWKREKEKEKGKRKDGRMENWKNGKLENWKRKTAEYETRMLCGACLQGRGFHSRVITGGAVYLINTSFHFSFLS